MSIKKTFDEAFNGEKNLFTPNVIRYEETGSFYVELSWGTGIFSDRMYGVTVITPDGERTEHGNCFPSLKEAEDYISDLS